MKQEIEMLAETLRERIVYEACQVTGRDTAECIRKALFRIVSEEYREGPKTLVEVLSKYKFQKLEV